MVIQSNMSPKAIVEVWRETANIFKKHHIPLTEKKLETLIKSDSLSILLNELNDLVGSSTATCIEGG
ncbi:hypothetical protein BGM26_09235 [Bacillus sp. FJAT-29790]|uniref:hypothetical protein n=1 Tax=Bacillus sp. FJAT-29790 TaxID=1895002 RepID=UPI001C245E00|nr:hypothetical protein [Bacillus sp. FJAT-29790]MBU8879167.1 hypothetical protein [Bacillus sp. FJAT-29790]